MPRRKTEQGKQKRPTRPEKSPVSGWRVIEKPKMTVKTGSAAREAREEEARRPLSFLGIVMRLLPVWILLFIILLVEPMLPLRAVGALFEKRSTPEPEPEQSEPVFIVQGGGGEMQDDLPAPTWDLAVSDVFMPGVQYWEEAIGQWSLQYRIQPNLIATLIQIESCGNPHTIDEDGTRGLFKVPAEEFGPGDSPFDPDTNARYGLTRFAEVFASANGNLGLALAAYNAGDDILMQSPSEWPAEAQYYQFWGSGIFEEAQMGLTQSPTLQDWLSIGGDDVCAEAADVLNLTP